MTLGALAAALSVAAAPEQGAVEGTGRVGEGAAPAALPPWVRREQAVEARQAAYRERLRRTYEALRARVEQDAPDVLPTFTSASPRPVRLGYQMLPRLVADPPRASERAATRARSYSWPWTEQMIERDAKKLDGLEAELDGAQALPDSARKASYTKMVADYTKLAEGARTIDAHIQYNRLWQPAIARDRPGYDRQTVLEHAEVERQAIRDALASTDDAPFRQALAHIAGIDASRARGDLERELRDREAAISREVEAETGQVTPPPFIHVEHPRDHLWVVHVPFYTDIADRQFVHAFEHAVQSVWRLRDGGDTFRVRLSIAYVATRRLYQGRRAPQAGDQIDVGAHAALFPSGGAVLTTGANTTHFTAGRCIAVAPHDLPPHVLAHEFGHAVGFKDVYFRGYRDLGEDGFEVTEVVADADDIMGDPGAGPVLRRHFQKLIGTGIPAAAGRRENAAPNMAAGTAGLDELVTMHERQGSSLSPFRASFPAAPGRLRFMERPPLPPWYGSDPPTPSM